MSYQDICQASRSAVIQLSLVWGIYIGSTYVKFYSMVHQYQGKSSRTGRNLASLVALSIMHHFIGCDTPFSVNDFKIFDTERRVFSLQIVEHCAIHKMKQSINKTSAFNLNIVT